MLGHSTNPAKTGVCNVPCHLPQDATMKTQHPMQDNKTMFIPTCAGARQGEAGLLPHAGSLHNSIINSLLTPTQYGQHQN